MRSILLPAGLSLATLGTAAVFVGVISAGLFYPGVFLIAIGMLVVMAAGVLNTALPNRE